MKRGEQIDKGPSRKYLEGATEAKKHQKKIHRKAMRRLAKDIEQPNPMHNRYCGWLL